MLRRLCTAAAVASSCLLLPAPAALASGADVIIDCNDNGRLTKEYSQKEYRQALAQLPADIRQYTDCENIIRRAQLGLPPVEANSGNPFAGATPEEEARARAEIEEFRKTGKAPQKLTPEGEPVIPGSLAFTKASAATTELPTPLLVLLGLIVAAVLAGGAPFLDRLRRGRGSGA